MLVSNPDPQKSGKYERIEVTLSYHLILDEHCGGAYRAGHQPRWVIPGVRIVFCATAKSYADGIFFFSTSSPAHALYIVCAGRGRVSQQDFLKIADVNA